MAASGGHPWASDTFGPLTGWLSDRKCSNDRYLWRAGRNAPWPRRRAENGLWRGRPFGGRQRRRHSKLWSKSL